MFKKSVIVSLVCVLALGFSGCSTAVENPSKKKQGSFTWNRRERLIIIVTGRHWVFNDSEFDEFAEEMQKVYGRKANVWGSPSFLNFTKKKIDKDRYRNNKKP